MAHHSGVHGTVGGEIQDNSSSDSDAIAAGVAAALAGLEAVTESPGAGVVVIGDVAGDIQNVSGTGNTQSITRR